MNPLPPPPCGNEKPGPCSLCGTAARVWELPNANATYNTYVCARCGNCRIDHLLELTLNTSDMASVEIKSRDTKSWLSIYTRHHDRSHLRTNNYEALAKEMEDVDPEERTHRMLKEIVKNSKGAGSTVDIGRDIDPPLYWAKDADEMIEMLTHLEEKGLISQKAETARGVLVSPTTRGVIVVQERFAAEKEAEQRGRIGFSRDDKKPSGK